MGISKLNLAFHFIVYIGERRYARQSLVDDAIL